MKRKLIEQTAPTPPEKKKGYSITAQLEKDILIINTYHNGVLQARHGHNIKTHEYETLVKGVWYQTKIEAAIMCEKYQYGYYSYYAWTDLKERYKDISDDTRLFLKEVLGFNRNYSTVMDYMSELETGYQRSKKERTENNRIERVRTMMSKVPPIPEGIKEWINQKAIGGEDYLIKTPEKGIYSCSHCGEEMEEPKARNNDMVECIHCHKKVKLLKRKKKVQAKAHFQIIQPIDNDVSTMRHFTAYFECEPGSRKKIGIEEDIRFILFKGLEAHRECDIYYEQYNNPFWCPDGGYSRGYFDNKSNPANKREHPGYMYEDGIVEGLAGTYYEKWSKLFKEFADAGLKLDYNNMMVMTRNEEYRSVMEMLFRNRFYKLLSQASNHVSIWGRSYVGNLHILEETIEGVFGIKDRQLINRIRDNDGGELMVTWLRYSEKHKQRINDKTLQWLVRNNIYPHHMGWINCRFSLEQAMNYMERQRKESYKGMSLKQVIEQYEDYMRMCERLDKKTTDALIFRPKNLKQRHDEAVELMAKHEAQIIADEYSRKFSEAENVLQEIKEKFEYFGEEYIITVPQRIVEVVEEGRALHHCAGATDRYFDRIKQHETYIVFLRKAAEPETPFYTVEVEPGGTIRQHRGLYDEEPDIELIKPFLREWQKVIRKRMSEEDHKRAAVSAVKREENIEELKRKNNTRVLQGLMEDFMEAM